MRRRKRLPDGSFGPLEDVFGGLLPEQQIEQLEESNINVMEAAALLFEENLSLKQSLIDNMDATALLFEELLALKGGA